MTTQHKNVILGKLLIGRHEWCSLPKLGIPLIKGKVDTGAKTSAIHAFNIKTKTKGRKRIAIFDIHPIQGNNQICITCEAPIIDEREIMSSNGHKESRLIIQTDLTLGNKTWQIEISLSNRDPLRYRFLLGREALRSRVLIDPDHTSHQKKVSKKILNKVYKK